LALLVLAGVLACGPPPRPRPEARTALEVVPEDQWPVLEDDLDVASFLMALRQSLNYLRRVPPGRRFRFGPVEVSAAAMIQGLDRLGQVWASLADARARTEALKRHFVLLRSVGSDGKGRVLMTGYYEPVLAARRRPKPPFVHPLYALPRDLVTIDLRRFDPRLPARRLVGQVRGHKVVPYPERREIDFGRALEGRAEVLAYVADPVDAFFLHIQGSGVVVFPDGSRLRLGYAGTNGRPYRSIGRLLLQEGRLSREEMSMQAIRRYLARHPEERPRILGHNPSYVFFRPLPAEGGPLGCYGMPLTTGRSIATDRRLFPGLAPAWIVGQRPALGGGEVPLARMVFNQDTGGAIRGPGRLDLFFGTGKEAGELAGRMKHPGRLYFLAPRER